MHPQPGAHNLWRRLEKGAENMLIGVDQILELTSDLPLGATFSAILTKRHLRRGSLKQSSHRSFRGFHRFTALITTTSFMPFQVWKIFCGIDSGCGLFPASLYFKRSGENRRFPPVSTVLKHKVGFISGQKASKVRQR
jgi:hypothetical protein